MNSILGSEDVQAEMTDDTTYKQLPDSSLMLISSLGLEVVNQLCASCF